MVRQRVLWEIRPERWAEFVAIQKKVVARWAELGLPTPRCFRPRFGGGTATTCIQEREFESMAAAEAFSESPERAALDADPQIQELRKQYMPFVESVRVEMLEEL
jgi:hypothetical protein